MTCVWLKHALQLYVTDLCDILFRIFKDPVPMLSTDDRMKIKKREFLINSYSLLVFFF